MTNKTHEAVEVNEYSTNHSNIHPDLESKIKDLEKKIKELKAKTASSRRK